jgi:hypothetical protein
MLHLAAFVVKVGRPAGGWISSVLRAILACTIRFCCSYLFRFNVTLLISLPSVHTTTNGPTYSSLLVPLNLLLPSPTPFQLLPLHSLPFIPLILLRLPRDPLIFLHLPPPLILCPRSFLIFQLQLRNQGSSRIVHVVIHHARHAQA